MSEHPGIPVAFVAEADFIENVMLSEFQLFNAEPGHQRIVTGTVSPGNLANVIRRIKGKANKRMSEVYPLQAQTGVVPLGALPIDTGFYEDGSTNNGTRAQTELLKLAQFDDMLGVRNEEGEIVGFSAKRLYDLVMDGSQWPEDLPDISRNAAKVVTNYLHRSPFGEESIAHQLALLD